MKTFLMYYDRYETNTTSSMLDFEHIVLCHNNADKFQNLSPKAQIIETGLPKGIQNNFNYALSMAEVGEWIIFLSDDLTKAQRFDTGKQDFVDCKINYTLGELKKAVEKADEKGIEFVGMNSTGNAYYMTNPYSYFGLIDTRCCALKKTEFLFHKDIGCIPDYYATCYHLVKNGANLIVNYTFLDFSRYSKGGLGSVDDRVEQKRKEVALMKQLFPNNVKIVDKANQPKGTHLRINR